MRPPDQVIARRQRIIAGLQGRALDQAIADPDLWADMKAESESTNPDRLVVPDMIRAVEQARAVQLNSPHLGLFFSTDDAIVVPGFLGSELVDVTGGNGLIWIDPGLLVDTSELRLLALNPFQSGQPDSDAVAGVTLRPNGAIPLLYGGLKYDLEVRRYSVDIFGFDWRKSIDESATVLAGVIRDRANRPFRPLHLVAHSQGTLVARRALQLLGADLAQRLVNTLVLLGPATAGTFSAAFAIAGTHSTIETLRRYGIDLPPEMARVFQSMTGLYQLLPWRTDTVNGADPDNAIAWVVRHTQPPQASPLFNSPEFWETGVDSARLGFLFGWGKSIDASFFNDRTTIILGDRVTVGGVRFVDGKLVEDPDFATTGDGTVPDSLARIEGVTRIYRATGAEHMMLPATLAVIAAVRDVLAGRTPRIDRALAAAQTDVPRLATPTEETPPGTAPAAAANVGPAAVADKPHRVEGGRGIPQPPSRRLRVYSFDPLLGTDLDALGTDQLTLQLPWAFADGDLLRPGPVGEYVEVVDFDPSNDCFYPPVDLNHPHLLAQDGLLPSEGEPRFHQQMVYAVSMNTIRHFELALGRTALWAPHLPRKDGEVVPGLRLEDTYVPRLRIYPHALRQANAYYHPDKKALLFGYFPAQGANVGRNLPGGTIFSCLSFDVVAHETTHALLDGLHRYFTEPSNPDVYAFHEAFADVVALLQHFSHPEVLRYQIARTRGDLKRESTLGVLAAQFGEATGHRGALRQYLGQKDQEGKWQPVRPDPTAIDRVREPHARGAILVAALFRAFANIYENRVQDLRRIATGGTGILAEGDLHPDLVSRLAEEAATAARHLLNMSIRALDYIPPVDVTFGEYLRALITADYDVVRDDDRRYRVAIVSAFRDWGIYPPDVRSLSVDSLLWSPPELQPLERAREFFVTEGIDGWSLHSDRRESFLLMAKRNLAFHDWLQANATAGRDQFMGLELSPDKAPKSIRRGKNGLPIFEVHSFRPCRRIGQDNQERIDIVLEIVQRRKAFFDRAAQQKVEDGTVAFDAASKPDFWFRGGCTLIVNPRTGNIRYCIAKSIGSANDERLDRERRFRQGQFGDRVGGIYLDSDERGNPFAFLHGGH